MGEAHVKGKERPAGTLSNDVIHRPGQPISMALLRPSQFLVRFFFPLLDHFYTSVTPLPPYGTVLYSVPTVLTEYAVRNRRSFPSRRTLSSGNVEMWTGGNVSYELLPHSRTVPYTVHVLYRHHHHGSSGRVRSVLMKSWVRRLRCRYSSQRINSVSIYWDRKCPALSRAAKPSSSRCPEPDVAT
jgi:hypothetical protein